MSNIYTRGHFLSGREGNNGTERTSNVAQVAVGCVLAYGIVFYGVKAQGYVKCANPVQICMCECWHCVLVYMFDCMD